MRIRLAVDDKGSPTSCTITDSSGVPDLDEIACQRLMERARFVPARDAEDRPTAGEFRQFISFRSDGLRPRPEPQEWNYTFVVEADGSVSSCSIETLEGVTEAWACGFPRGPVYKPILDDNGRAVRTAVKMTGQVSLHPAEDGSKR